MVSLQNLNFLVFADDTSDVVGYQECDFAEEQLMESQSRLLLRLSDETGRQHPYGPSVE